VEKAVKSHRGRAIGQRIGDDVPYSSPVLCQSGDSGVESGQEEWRSQATCGDRQSTLPCIVFGLTFSRRMYT
jgi:hypothetical protein